MKALHLLVLSPEAMLLDVHDIERVQVTLADGGGLGIYPGHAPLLADTVPGPVRYVREAEEHVIDLAAGILFINDGTVQILTPGSEADSEAAASEEDVKFDRLARELMNTLSAHAPDADDVGMLKG